MNLFCLRSYFRDPFNAKKLDNENYKRQITKILTNFIFRFALIREWCALIKLARVLVQTRYIMYTESFDRSSIIRGHIPITSWLRERNANGRIR
jgi:hypothetical protein